MKRLALYSRCHKVSKIGAVFTLLLSISVMMGWIFDIGFLKSIMPNWATMKITTAIGFMLLGSCILLIQSKKNTQNSIMLLVTIFTIMIMIYSALVLTEYIFTKNLGFDLWLFDEPKSAVAPYPGRMAFISALNFFLSGIAILYYQFMKKRTLWPAHSLALFIFLNSLDAIFGLTYGVRSIFGGISHTQLSIHTSIAFIFISISILFLDPRSGFTKIFILDSIGGTLAWKLFPSVLALPLLIGYLAFAGEQLNLYDEEFRIIVVMMSFFLLLMALVWRTAYSLHLAEQNYKVVTKKLQKTHLLNKELIDTKEYLEEVSNKDTLTGLSNRAHFYGLLEHAIFRAKRYKTLVGLLFIDLDNFKQINDQFGHETGDKLLQSFALRTKSLLREVDSVARLGGDEFTVILEDSEEIQNIKVVVTRIIESLKTPFLINNHVIKLSISIGVSSYPKDGMDIETLLRNADIAMYQAKKTGKNKFQFYQDDYKM